MFCRTYINQIKAKMVGDLREDLVLDERVLRADLLRVEGGVEGLLCFDARSAI